MAEDLPQIRVHGSRVESPAAITTAMKSRTEVHHTPKEARSGAENSAEAKLSLGAKGFPKLIRNLSNNQIGQREGNATAHLAAEGRKDPVVMDPLSQHLFKRNLTDNMTEGRPQGTAGDWGAALPPNSLDLTVVKRADTASTGSRDKKKGVSFLSRFIGNKKKDSSTDFDDELDSNDNRMEGLDADVFSQPIGFIPRFPAPPKYIKVRSRGKKEKDFGRVFLAQELKGRTGAEIAQAGGRSTKNGALLNPADIEKMGNAIWAMEFSQDGKYLAAGGRDHMVRVWTVISTVEDRQAHEAAEDAADGHGESVRLSAPVFKSGPTEYEGHSQSILDLSWSKNNFLLSSSMDKTVRLWHISRTECLCCFKHSDFVTSVQFHPRDDRFFLAGSLDSRLRLWSIPDKSVAFSVPSPDLITAVAFTPDGKTAIAGCLNGLCSFYDTEGLKIQTQMHVRSAHGKNAKGSKITGIQTISYPSHDLNGEVKLLITSNDSRVRMYNFREKTLELKLKGNENNFSQIHASFSDDAQYIICGSEDRKAYVWSTAPPEKEKDRRPFEMFSVSSAIVTIAIMAPTKTRQLLGGSGDPLYDLCNPPPVTLVDRTESYASSASPESRSPTGDTSIQPTPVNAYFSRPAKLEESPAYIARGKHSDGNIIIAADYMGQIKVFRQDCAYEKRMRNEGWDNSSALSKKSIRRSNSVATRNSFGSKRNSTISKQPSSDRINTWRQSINSNHSNSSSFDNFRNSLNNQGRSASPRKPLTPSTTPRHNSHPFGMHRNASISTTSNPPSLHKPFQDHPPESPCGDVDSNPLRLQGDASFMFYDKEIWRSQATNGNYLAAFDGASTDRDGGSSKSGTSANGNFLGVPIGRERTAVSVLSSEESSVEEEGGEVRCTRCGGGQFMAKKGRAGMGLECVKCGAVA